MLRDSTKSLINIRIESGVVERGRSTGKLAAANQLTCRGGGGEELKLNGMEGYGSKDLRLYTSTKLKMVNYWFYPLKHKKTKFIFK
jgi:hypothetical protein